MSIFAFFHSTHDLHQLKKAQLRLRVIPAMYAKFVGTLIIMSFHASVWLHAARALLRSYALASGHVGPDVYKRQLNALGCGFYHDKLFFIHGV